MIKHLIANSWKEWKRSSFWQKNLATNIILGFLMLIMLLYLLLIGIFISEILKELFPDQHPAYVFNSILIYYFLGDLFFRYLIQSLPALQIEPYLHLPVSRKKIIHYLIIRSALHPMNYAPWLVFIPFTLRVIVPEFTMVYATGYLITIFLLIYNNNFLATYFKRQLVSKPLITGIAGIVLLSVAVLDHLQMIGLSTLSARLFNWIIHNPWFVLMAVLMAATSYSANYLFLKERLYPEEVTTRKKTQITFTDSAYLSKLGLTGSILGLEIKLWLRHKRTRSNLTLLPLFVLYGFFFYPNPQYKDMGGMLIFVGIFMSGGMMLNYLNYAFGYEAAYFDHLLTSRIEFGRYLMVKFTVGVIISTFCFIITIPYLFFGKNILFINIATWLFNIGVLSYVLLWIATFNTKRMNLTKGAAFNYQGVGAGNWLAMIPAFLLPVLIYWPFSSAGMPNTGLVLIGAFGIAGLILFKPLMMIIEKKLASRKYVMAESFRNSD